MEEKRQRMIALEAQREALANNNNDADQVQQALFQNNLHQLNMLQQLNANLNIADDVVDVDHDEIMEVDDVDANDL